MEKISKLFYGLIIASSLLISCDKGNDNDIPQRNHLKIRGTEYVLSKGIYENYGLMIDDLLQHDGYNLDLTLVSEGFTISTDSFGYADVSGSGQAIYFVMFSSKGDEFDSRDYTFSSSEPHPIGTFDDSSAWGIITSVGSAEATIKSGKVTISKGSSEYSITIDCISENGEAVTGFFKGSLQYFDYTTFEKVSTSLIPTKNLKKKLIHP